MQAQMVGSESGLVYQWRTEQNNVSTIVVSLIMNANTMRKIL